MKKMKKKVLKKIIFFQKNEKMIFFSKNKKTLF